MDRQEYLRALHPRISARERRTMLRLRAWTLVWVVFVVTVVYPPAILAGLLVPAHVRRYGRRLER